MKRRSVLVVGAGPTGLTLACSLLQHGVDVAIVDQAAGPASTSRALGLQLRGAEVLDRVGALADIPDRAVKALNAHIDADGEALTLPIGQGSRDGRQTMFISQAEIEAELRRRLTELGEQVKWDTELVDIQDDAGGVVATVQDNTGDHTVRSGWLVGADGAYSATRRLSGIGFPGSPLYERVVLADVRADWGLDREGTTIWIRGGELFAVIPLPGSDDWRLFASIPEDFPEHASADDVIAAFAPKLRQFTGYDATVLKAVGWTSVFRINRRLVDNYRKGRIFLAGDAAHIHSPLGARG
jgi:2-polyprenyl-6-methoxyphenol hydroxylase-like FAD-dependent oxidoreductase